MQKTDNRFLVFFRQGGEHRQAEDLLGDARGDGEIVRRGARKAAVGREVAAQRIEIPAGHDVVRFELVVQLVARHAVLLRVDADREVRVVVPDAGDVVQHRNAGDVLQRLAVILRDLLAFCDLAVHDLQLEQAVRGAEFVHLAVCAGRDDRDLVCKPEVLQEVDPFLQVLVVRDERAALERVEDLRRVEAQHGEVAPVADGHAVLAHAEHMRGIVEQLQTVRVGDLLQFLVVARVAVDVDRHQRGRLRRDQRFDLVRIHGVGVRFDVAEDRLAVVPVDRMRRGHERERRRDNFARDAERLKSDLQRDHPVGEQRDILDTEVLGEFRLELFVEFAAVREPFVVPYLPQIRDEIVQRRERRRGDVDGFRHV